MKKTKLITVLCILAVVLLLGVFALPTTAQAATCDAFTYTVSNGEATIIEYDGNVDDLVIPSTLDGYPVVAIGDSAFVSEICDNLTSITIPASVQRIGNGAFSGCINLVGIWVDDDNANYCSDSDGVLFDKEKTALIKAPPCGISGNYTIPDSVQSIGKGAFDSCTNLTSVTIPDSVQIIGNLAFNYCSRLTGIWVDEDNANYCSDSAGVLFDKEKTTLIQAPGRISGDYTIPDSVQSIGKCAFEDCYSLTSVTIPDRVTSIGDYAFSSCGLTSVTIGDNVTSIGHYAFRGNNLTSVTIPDSVTSIGNYAFHSCWKLTSVTIGDGVQSIGDYAFSECWKLTNATIGNSVQSIGDYAFSDCYNLTSVTIGDSVQSIGKYAFEYCYDLTSVTIGNSVTSIGNYAFYDCNRLTDVYYTGTQSQWEAINVGKGNECLLFATIHYEYVLVENPGDLDGDGTVNNKDVEYLLWYTLFPGSYPVTGNADFDGDGAVNNKDVEYLLWHTLFPDSYPLTK